MSQSKKSSRKSTRLASRSWRSAALLLLQLFARLIHHSRMNSRFVALCLFALSFGFASSRAEPLTLHTRRAGEQNVVQLDPKKTAIVICDMWNQHWCKGATERVAEMAPRMNEVVKKARAQGVFIIHAPSETMKFYEGTLARKRAQAAPHVPPKVALQRWNRIDPARETALP